MGAMPTDVNCFATPKQTLQLHMKDLGQMQWMVEAIIVEQAGVLFCSLN